MANARSAAAASAANARSASAESRAIREFVSSAFFAAARVVRAAVSTMAPAAFSKYASTTESSGSPAKARATLSPARHPAISLGVSGERARSAFDSFSF